MAVLTLTKIGETATSITLGWTPVGDRGYRFTREKANGKWSNTWDASRDRATFSKDSAWYKVEALGLSAEGTYPPPAPPLAVVQSIKDGQVIDGKIEWSAVPTAAIASADFYIDGVLKWTEHLAPYVFNGDGGLFDPETVPEGGHEFKVVATDATGWKATAAATATTKHATTPPPPTIGLPGRVGTVFVNASSTDYVTQNPTQAQKDWMNAHWDHVYGWEGWWSSRKSWYSRLLIYIDSYAIYKSQGGFNSSWFLYPTASADAAKRLMIPWGCANGDCPQWAADIGNPEWQNYYADQVVALAKAGYEGLYADDVNLDRIAVSDGTGKLVVPWNKRKAAPYTLDQWQSDFADFMSVVRTKARAVNPNFKIVHNSLWWAKGTHVDRCIKQADWFSLERGFNDGNYSAQSFKDLFAWIDRLHSLGVGAYHLSYAGDAVGAEMNLACALIASNGNDLAGSSYGMKPPGVSEGWLGVYDAHLDNAQPRTYNGTNGLYRRQFDKGVALFLEPGRADVTSDGVLLKARQGRVLVH